MKTLENSYKPSISNEFNIKGSDVNMAVIGTNVTRDTISKLDGFLNEVLSIALFCDVIEISTKKINRTHRYPRRRKYMQENNISSITCRS